MNNGTAHSRFWHFTAAIGCCVGFISQCRWLGRGSGVISRHPYGSGGAWGHWGGGWSMALWSTVCTAAAQQRCAGRSVASQGLWNGSEQALRTNSSCQQRFPHLHFVRPQKKQCFCPRSSGWGKGECFDVWLGDLGAELHGLQTRIPCCQCLIPNHPHGFSADHSTRRLFILFSFYFSYPLPWLFPAVSDAQTCSTATSWGSPHFQLWEVIFCALVLHSTFPPPWLSMKMAWRQKAKTERGEMKRQTKEMGKGKEKSRGKSTSPPAWVH